MRHTIDSNLKKFFFVMVTLIAALLAFIILEEFSMLKKESATSTTSGTLNIVASFYPLGEFASQIAGSDATVSVITPAGIEPHEYEPTPQQISAVKKADIFLSNGGGFDTWSDTMFADENSSQIHISMTKEILGDNAIEFSNPHIWLDPIIAIQEIELIRDALIAKNPALASEYTQRAADYIVELQKLNSSYEQGLSSCAQHEIIVNHDAFAHLAARYGFEAKSINGISPEQEASAQQLKELADIIKEKQIAYIFFETLASPKVADTLARETGAQTLVLNPLEGLSQSEQSQGKNYISIMQENLMQLKKALVCQ